MQVTNVTEFVAEAVSLETQSEILENALIAVRHTELRLVGGGDAAPFW